MRTRQDLISLFQGTGCELGVAAGAYSSAILGNGKVSRLYSIDRWSDHHGLAEYKLAAERLASAGPNRCIPLRMSFHEAAPLFAPDSLDFVYVDGYAHTGQESGATLEEWWPMLKPGGVMAGHDYCPKYQPTIDAVDTFVRRHGLEMGLTTDDKSHASWWVIKPISSEPPVFTIAPNASVVLVGNGPSVIGRSLGHRIDQFDEIVRFNRYRIAGFEEDVGTRTTIWSTFGHGYLPGDDNQRPSRILFVYGDRGHPAYQPQEMQRIPLDYYKATKTRMLALSNKHEGQKQQGMSSGFMAAIYFLDFLRIPKIALVGFDHFRKDKSGQHHYYNPKTYGRPPELDGDAEAAVLADYAAAGRVEYLT